MLPRDHLIQAVQLLCSEQGGVDSVAEAAGVSAEYLRQIIAGVKLPSGEPRGPGPGVQRKLEKAFPGWATNRATEPPRPYAGGQLPQQLALDLDDLPPGRVSAIIDMIHQEAEQARAAAAHILAKRQPSLAAGMAKGKASGTLKIHLGDGNPGQGCLPLRTVDDPFTAEPDEREKELYGRFQSSSRSGR